MTDLTGQELAKYWLPTLNKAFPDFCQEDYSPEVFWHSPRSASPIIAHLIQEYMEGEGFDFDYYSEGKNDRPRMHSYNYFGEDVRTKSKGKNKWLANALAAWKAKEGR